jgi:G:T-mismatch repair DNA endonuclease (very short patch repair protein)
MPTPKDPEKREREVSEETRAKISASLTGKKLSPETRKKLSEARRGKVVSPETRKKISESQKGKPRWTDEDKAKMSKKRKGTKSSPEVIAKRAIATKEALQRPETKARMSAAQKGKVVSAKVRSRASEVHKGKFVSVETRKKLSQRILSESTRITMSKSQSLRWERKSEEEKTAQIERIRISSLKITNSWIEKVYAQKLDEASIVYESQKHIGWYNVDFYIPSENKVVEINGCYWHACPQCQQNGKSVVENYEQKREQDKKRYEYLKRKGYIVEIVWEHDLPRKR